MKVIFELLKHIILEMRLKQWTKNLFVYAALLFNGSMFNIDKFYSTSVIFLAFCLMSSAVYFFNDIFDYEIDKANPDKRNRPIASGAISIRQGYFFSSVLFLTSMILSYHSNLECLCLLLSYAVINLLYTIKLKHVVIIDVMIIAYGFVVRSLAGAWASSINLTEWFILCVMFLSLFLALGKRRHELINSTKVTAGKVKVSGRKVLRNYSVALIDQMTTIVLSALVMCYALFTMDSHTQDRQAMILTIPLVLYGTFYYLYVMQIKGKGGSPDVLLYKEKPILLVVLIYVVSIIFIRNI